MISERIDSGKSLLVAAFDHWLSGLLFAILVSCLVVSAAELPGLGWMLRSIEARGIDAAMRGGLMVTPLAPVGAEPRIGTAGYVFIALDTPLCMQVSRSKFCETRSPASPQAAIAAATAAIQGEAQVVIIDT